MIDLGRQLENRLRAWREELPNHLYHPVADLAFEGFVTRQRLPLREAARRPRAPFAPGDAWGGKWEYGWFFTTLPAFSGRLALFSGVGGEQLVYLNGQPVGAVDREHPYVTVDASGGEIAVESYAGHGPRLENIGPCPPDRPALPPTPAAQCTVRASRLCAVDETAYQLWVDVEVLWDLLRVLPDNSLRAQRVADALDAFTRVVDLEAPRPDFAAGREALRGALSCVNGSSAPLMHLIGQSHIDLMWLWPAEETRRKIARTLSTQLSLMEAYPEYRFLLCEPALLEWLQEDHPQTYARVLDAVSQGRMLPDGAFYVECDCNLPSGESLIRQLTLGREWFRRECGVDSTVAWQPDTFGFSAALPQILRGCGVRYFATQKLLRQDPECQPFPYQNFLWEGLDGSTVLSHMFFRSNCYPCPSELHRRWERDRVQKRDISGMLFPFGHGDGGGGATRDMLEAVRRLEDLEGVPRTRYASLRSFFEGLGEVNNRWVGELYLAWHRGCYTAQRKTKALARRLEQALGEAEALLALTDGGAADVRPAWKTLLLHQFHDVMGGVGIARVHQEAAAALSQAAAGLQPLLQRLRARFYGIRPAQDAWTLVNPLPVERREWVCLPDGREVFARLGPLEALNAPQEPGPEGVCAREDADGFALDNGLLRLRVDREGRIVSLTREGMEWVAQGGALNDWRLYQDVNPSYDAWELSRTYERCELPSAFAARASLARADGHAAEIVVERTFGQSVATQRILLRAGSPRVDFITRVDWRERHRLLKVWFCTNLQSDELLSETQFGYVGRPAHASHPFAADRYEVCQHRFSALCEEGRGLALLNDGCYGIGPGRGAMSLTLLRAPLVPDDTCDRGVHDIAYALYPFAVPFAQARVAEAAACLNQPVAVLPGRCSGAETPRVTGRGAILETLKPADDGDGMILRLYESLRLTETATLRLPWPAEVTPVSLDEREILGEPSLGREHTVALGPFKIVTLRVKRISEAAR